MTGAPKVGRVDSNLPIFFFCRNLTTGEILTFFSCILFAYVKILFYICIKQIRNVPIV